VQVLYIKDSIGSSLQCSQICSSCIIRDNH